jgi:hypothetical protein
MISNAGMVAVGMVCAGIIGAVFGFAFGWVVCARSHGDEVVRELTPKQVWTDPGWMVDGIRMRWMEIPPGDRMRARWVGEIIPEEPAHGA